MTKTNTRRRIVSVLLTLVMLVSLIPSMVIPAHAFWEDYDNGKDCEYCDHYHWAENMCDGCGFCTVDCNSDCFVEFHCNDCGECLFNTAYWCDECYKCAECMEEKHCSTCGKCYIGEDDQLCGECHKGPCCSITICDSCGFCDDCANDDSDPMHCSLCNSCFGAVDECVDDDDTGVIHCVDCHTSCEQCEECLLAKESCEDCGLCIDCCRDNSEGGGCPDGETCVESAEWDEHICQGCGGWVADKEDEDEFCETCELCKECCEGNSDCSEGMCVMDTDYADHFCEDCGLCFHDSDPCEDGCDQRCKDCCLDAVRAMGCDHDDWCFSDSDFENHLKTEHSGAGHTHIASATWEADGTQHWHPCRYCDGKKLNPANHEYDAKGVCKVCGYISGSSIVITRQPKGVKCKTSIYDDYNEEPENGLLYYENHPITFSVSARSLKGDELTYQWYRKDNERPTAAPYKLDEWPNHFEGVNTPTLRLSVSTQACQEDYSYYCVIGRKGDPSDTMKTAEAKLTATHAFSYNQGGEIVYTDDGEKVPEYDVTWVDKHGNTHKGFVGGVRKSEGHKLACLFEAGEYEAHYMTTGTKERIFPHKFAFDRSLDAVGGGQFFFEPVYAGCDHSGGTTVLNAKAQVCDRKGYTGDTACADCGYVISAGSDIYPPANAGHTGPLQPLYYYGTSNSATTDASHGGKRYNVNSGDCRHRAYEGDYRCTACGGTVKGETGDFRHSGPFELRDVRAATCTEKGYSGNQYCTACDRIAQKGVSTPSLHEIAGNSKLINVVKPGCTTTGYSGDQQCTAGCGQIFRYGHVINKLSHEWDGGKPAKQGKSEGILYTCQRADCGETRFVRSPAATEYTVTVIKGTASVAAGTPITDKIAQNTVVTVTADAPEAGKVFDKWVVLEGNVTLADATKATTTFTMPGNDVKLEATYKDAPPSHIHSYGTEWKYDGTNHWHECACGDKANIAAHSASEWIVDTAATETADGAKHKECTVCKKVLETAPIPATGSAHTHSYGTEWKYDDTNHWHECQCGDKADTAAHSFQWVIDKAATKEATGLKHEECTVCGAKHSENTVIDKLPDGGNTGNTSSGDNNTDKPGKDDSTKSTQTGDSSNLIGWLAALFVVGGVLTLLGVSSKKRKESEAE